MNDLYIHQLETENKQLRIALQECRKALEEEITSKKKAIEYIKALDIEDYDSQAYFMRDINKNDIFLEDLPKILLEILGDKENE